MKLDPILTKAARLLRRGKYGETVRVLETEAVRYHGSFKYYYMLAVSCLRSGDWGGALTYFKRAREIKMRDPSALLGLAALFLRRGETDRAVDLYLEVQEVDPKNRIAKRALQVIRRNGGAEKISAWVEAGKLRRLYPPLPELPLTWERVVIPVAAALILLGLGALGVLFRLGILGGKPADRDGLAGSALEREERAAPVQVEGSYRFVLTQKEVLDGYAAAQSLFTEFRDEPAKVALNRIIESNASEAIKNKARILISYMTVPGFDTLKDRFSYAEVMEEPVLYRDCYIVWRGMAANLEALQDSTAFNFLVGYDTRTALEGIVPVTFDFSVPVNIERPLEVLGQIIPVSTPGGADIRIKGIAVHQSGLLEPP